MQFLNNNNSLVASVALFCAINASAFTQQISRTSSVTQLHAKVGVYYSTIGGNTADCAGLIAEELGVQPMEIDDADINDLKSMDCLIVGAPTWNTGADTERSMTTWDQWLYSELPNIDLTGKKVAVFGCGDQISYSFNYADSVGELYDCFTGQGADGNFGKTSTDGYRHVESKAVGEDGQFLGALFDQDNQSDLSADRAKAWVAQLKEEGFTS
eukprot:CAMPEP_0194146964 /NCGR_PEP_ID=MMETSP0152-20130528/22437_1 /TAXON_ID=1049557 /ORGANISM="Thalassiothrix antarctica, Strain L6-D1" /LENGTH=212 /DNA_ID=CAMNT_0038847623 /DNA_START=106 /DNA_END=744 /DNA_ORIENTATION=+